MGLLSRKNQANEGDSDEASRIAVAFYTKSNNSDKALIEAARRIKGLDLTREQISDIRMCLPVSCGGTGGQKVARIDRVLKRLEKELI